MAYLGKTLVTPCPATLEMQAALQRLEDEAEFVYAEEAPEAARLIETGQITRIIIPRGRHCATRTAYLERILGRTLDLPIFEEQLWEARRR